MRKRKNYKWSPRVWGGHESSRFLTTSPQKEAVCRATTAVPGQSRTYRDQRLPKCVFYRLVSAGRTGEVVQNPLFCSPGKPRVHDSATLSQGDLSSRGQAGSMLLPSEGLPLRNSSGHTAGGLMSATVLAMSPLSPSHPPALFFGRT